MNSKGFNIINKEEINIEDIKDIKLREIIRLNNNLMMIDIFEEFDIDVVLNIPTELKTNNIVVKITLKDNTTQTPYELKYEKRISSISRIIKDIDYILSSRCIGEITYKYSLCKHQISPGCKIMINGKLAIIADFSVDFKDSLITNLRYIPLKKDGTVSKVKPRLIYNNVLWDRVITNKKRE